MFSISAEDVQDIALKKIGRKLTEYELNRVKKGIESGLECWEDIVIYAIKEIVNEIKKER